MPNSVVKTLTVNGTTYDLKDIDSELYAPKASPALTGTPTAPTATSGTNSTQIATTAFVQGAVSSAIGNVNSFEVSVVQSLPTTNIDTHTIYFISNSGSTGNIYDEYMYINNNWEKIGTTDVDLSGYLAKNNTTAFTPSGDYNPATKKYVDENIIPFITTITSTTANDVTTYSADKTFAEITEAYESGKNCIVIKQSNIYVLSIMASTGCCFTNTYANNNFNRIAYETIRISSSDVITIYNKPFLTTDGTHNVYSNKKLIASVNGNFNTTPTTGSLTYSTTAYKAYEKDDLFWKDNSTLAKATTDISSGGTLTENTNYVSTTISDELKDIRTMHLSKTNTTAYTPTANYHPATKKYVDDAVGAGGTQSDWNENDTTSSSYIQNRTHYTEDPITTEVWTYSSSDTNTYHEIDISNNNSWFKSLSDGIPYSIVFNDTTYTGNLMPDRYDGYILGNGYMWGYSETDSGEPFVLLVSENWINLGISESYTFSNLDVSLSITTSNIHKLDSKYLDGSLIMSGSGRNSEIFNGITYDNFGNANKQAIGTCSHIEGNGDVVESPFFQLNGVAGATEYSINNFYYDNRYIGIILGKELYSYDGIPTGVFIEDYNVNSTTGIGTITLSQTLDENNAILDLDYYIIISGSIASGLYSHAEGYNNHAIGDYSHSEGYNNKTLGYQAHSEGSVTTASGSSSHSEGTLTIASGSDSHAEGNTTIASGSPSHAEGSETTASGGYSHAEGRSTIASGTYSHVEGYYTTAQRRSQHVFGEYNILDTGGSSTSAKGTYIEIVGKGTSSSARSNARTLDWSGNEVLAGKLTVGVAPTNDMDVATKKYVDDNAGGGGSSTLIGLTDTSISSPTNGQILMYNSTSGKWENTTLPIYNGGVSS